MLFRSHSKEIHDRKTQLAVYEEMKEFKAALAELGEPMEPEVM